MKQVAGKLKLELAQFTELEAFSQFASDLDPVKCSISTCSFTWNLKASTNSPYSVADQIVRIYSGTNGHLDDLEVTEVVDYLARLIDYLRTSKPEYGQAIRDTKALGEEAEQILKQAIETVKNDFKAVS